MLIAKKQLGLMLSITKREFNVIAITLALKFVEDNGHYEKRHNMRIMM